MKRALIVVDYQRDFVTGSLGFPGAVALAERIAKKIAAYHKSGDVVLFTMDTHTDNYLNTQEGASACSALYQGNSWAYISSRSGGASRAAGFVL